MMTATLLAAVLLSPAQAFDRLPAAPQALSLVTSMRAASASFGVRPERLLAAAPAGAGLDAIFAPAGAAGTIDGGRSGAKGTYTIQARAADRVVIGLSADLGVNRVVATLTLTRSGSDATLAFDAMVSTPSDPSEPPEHIVSSATGRFTFDPATGAGTISYTADGQTRTETFSQTPTGMKMTLLGMPHTLTRTR